MPPLTPLASDPDMLNHRSMQTEVPQTVTVPPLLKKAAAAIAVHFLFADSPMALPFPLPHEIIKPVIENIFQKDLLQANTFDQVERYVELNLQHEHNAGWTGFLRNVEGNMIDILGGGYKLPWFGRNAPVDTSQRQPGTGRVLYWLRFNILAFFTMALGFALFILVLVLKSTQNYSRSFLVLLWPAGTLTAYSYLQLDRSISFHLYWRRMRQRVIVDPERWQHVISVTEEPSHAPVINLQAHNLWRAIFFSVVTGLVLMALFLPFWPDDITNPALFDLGLS